MNKEDGKWIKIQDCDVKVNDVSFRRCFHGHLVHQGASSFVDAWASWCRKFQNEDWVPEIRGVSFSDPEKHKLNWSDKWFAKVDLQSYDRNHVPGSNVPWEWTTLVVLLIIDDLDTDLLFSTLQEKIDWVQDSYVDPGW